MQYKCEFCYPFLFCSSIEQLRTIVVGMFFKRMHLVAKRHTHSRHHLVLIVCFGDVCTFKTNRIFEQGSLNSLFSHISSIITDERKIIKNDTIHLIMHTIFIIWILFVYIREDQRFVYWFTEVYLGLHLVKMFVELITKGFFYAKPQNKKLNK